MYFLIFRLQTIPGDPDLVTFERDCDVKLNRLQPWLSNL